MTTTHLSRRTARSAALAAVTATLALGLAACGGGDADAKTPGGDRPAGTAQSRPAPDASGKGGTRQTADGAAPTRGSSVTPSGAKGEAPGKGAAAGVQACRGDELMVTAVHRFAGEQGDHLLVTASNAGTKPCWVTSYPAVKLGGDVDTASLPHSKKDNPGGDRRITLRAGAKVYSAVNLFDYGSKHHTAQSFALALRGADGREGPFYSVDAKGEKPRFSWNEADVLNWNTEKPYEF